MADEKEFVLTREGKLELENELDTLKNVTRKEVSEKIKEARSFGDLSENAEYDEAKNEQAEVEARINEIEYMLKYARVIDDEEIKSDVVTPGSKVVLAIFGGEEKYTIVGSTGQIGSNVSNFTRFKRRTRQICFKCRTNR